MGEKCHAQYLVICLNVCLTLSLKGLIFVWTKDLKQLSEWTFVLGHRFNNQTMLESCALQT